MPPRQRPATRAQSRILNATASAPVLPEQTPEGHVQTLPYEGNSAAPAAPRPPLPPQVQQLDPAPAFQAVSQLLDVLERRSRDLVQQEQSRLELAALARAPTVQPSVRATPGSPQTVVSRQQCRIPRCPAYDSPVVREKRRGRPPTPPSPSDSDSDSDSDSSSSNGNSSSDSSSSRSPSPKKKTRKTKHKNKEKNSAGGAFTLKIQNYKIPKAWEKPPPLGTYDGTSDPDDHVEEFNRILDYRGAPEEVRCKLFPLTLKKSASKWFRDLPVASISSWKQLSKLFTSRFTASRLKPKSVDILRTICQGESESLRAYIERYNKEADEVHNVSDEVRMMFLRHGLRKGTLFHVNVGLRPPATLNDFLRRAQRHIDYEESNEAMEGADASTSQVKGKDPKDKSKKEGGGAKEWRSRFIDYSPLNASKSKILQECANAEFNEVKWPAPIPQRHTTNKKAYCRYHRSHGHDTEDCRVLKDDIEDLIQRGKLRQYLKTDEKKRDRSPRKSKPAINEVAKPDSEDSDSGEDLPRAQRQRPVAMVVMGGYSLKVGETRRSMKRRWGDILGIGGDPNPVPINSGRPPLTFDDSELPSGKANKWLPLIVSAVISGTEVKRILVDQGSSSDLMFKDLLPKLHISDSDLLAYDGGGLTGFNGSRTIPLGYLELMVTYGEEKHSRTVKTRFLVLPCSSPYNCIVGRPTLGRLGAVTSTVHLKMKFFSEEGKAVTIRADQEATKRCHYLCMKEERRAEKEDARRSEIAAGKRII